MLPGTIMYVYIGSIGRAASKGKTPGEWALTILGLIATIVVTVYITRIAKKAINRKVTK